MQRFLGRTGDELLSDSYDISEIQDGFFFEVEGKWTVLGDVEVNIGGNPSAEGGDEGEGVESASKKVVDIIDAFRLQEGPSYSKKDFMGYVKPWLSKVLEKLPEDKQAEFKTKSQPALKYLISMIKDLQFYTSENMDPDTTMIYAYYKEGSSNPTFLFPKYALVEEKC